MMHRCSPWLLVVLLLSNADLDAQGGGRGGERGGERSRSYVPAAGDVVRILTSGDEPPRLRGLRLEGQDVVLVEMSRETLAAEDPRDGFRLVEAEAGSLFLESVASGLVLDVEGASVEPGRRVLGYARHGGKNQQWKLREAAGGWVIESGLASGLVLEARPGGSPALVTARGDDAHGRVFRLARYRARGMDGRDRSEAPRRAPAERSPAVAAAPPKAPAAARAPTPAPEPQDTSQPPPEGSLILTFDGTGYAEMEGFYPHTLGGNVLFVSLWANPRNRANQCFLGLHSKAGENAFLIGQWGGKLVVTVNGKDASLGEAFTGWKHVVVVVQKLSGMPHRSKVRLFLDTRLAGEQDVEGWLGDWSGGYRPLVLGQDWDGDQPSDFLQGKLANPVVVALDSWAEGAARQRVLEVWHQVGSSRRDVGDGFVSSFSFSLLKIELPDGTYQPNGSIDSMAKLREASWRDPAFKPVASSLDAGGETLTIGGRAVLLGGKAGCKPVYYLDVAPYRVFSEMGFRKDPPR